MAASAPTFSSKNEVIDWLAPRIKRHLEIESRVKLCSAINATGTVLHTGLGRAPLPESAVVALSRELASYSALSVDPLSNERARRERHAAGLVCRFTGAKACTIVNNTAAAVLLTLSCLAKGRQVIVSRGQLVEIGGSFRLPDIMRQSGAKLVEVGTTNRTYIKDYADAVTPATAMILKVHSSNFKQAGFVHEASTDEIARLARRKKLIFTDDVGSGALFDTSRFGLVKEPMPVDSITSGANLVLFSGDKLLGGPQSGIIAGDRKLIDMIRSHQLFRALRVDKLTLVCLEQTLRLFLYPELLPRAHPVYRMLSASTMELSISANTLAKSISAANPSLGVSVVSEFSDIGGGSLPGSLLPTSAIKVNSSKYSPSSIARSLRANVPPVFVRVKDDSVLLDIRTIKPDEYRPIADAFSML